jgi:hypothetical protein
MVEEENLIQLIGREIFVGKCCLSCSWSKILWCSSFIILEHNFCNCHLKMCGWLTCLVLFRIQLGVQKWASKGGSMSSFSIHYLSQPHSKASVRMKLTLPKVGTSSPSGLSKTHSLIARAKTLRIEVFFIPLEWSWSVNVEIGLA